jgi:hypothetical protein
VKAEKQDRSGVSIEPVVVPDREVKRYHCGALETLPFYSVTVGGYSFPRVTELVTVDEQTRETLRAPRPGAFYELSELEVARIKDAISRKVVRWANKERHKGYILNVKESDGSANKRYRKIENDEPLGKHLYMKEVPAELDIKPGSPLVS